MPNPLISYKIFLASPGGLNTERQLVREVVQEVNELAAEPDGVRFEIIGWENTLGGVGRPQQLINEDVRTCDYVFLLMHDRWGTPSSDTFTSGTEEEYHVAMEGFATGQIKEVAILFKPVSPEKLADPGAQLSKVLDFKKTLERERTHLYQTFESDRHLSSIIKAHLFNWLRKAKNIPAIREEVKYEGINILTSLSGLNNSTSKASDYFSIRDDLEKANSKFYDGKLTEAEILYAKILIHCSSGLWRFSSNNGRIRKGERIV
jgi:hypothetical protein